MENIPANRIERAAVLADTCIDLLSGNAEASAMHGRVCMLLTYLIRELMDAHDALVATAIATDQVGATEGLLN